jgi:hypothetical protein
LNSEENQSDKSLDEYGNTIKSKISFADPEQNQALFGSTQDCKAMSLI